MTDETPTRATLATLPEDRIAQLATAPHTTVYRYTNDAPEGTMTYREQADALRDLCASFDALCVRQPGASVEALRQTVLRSAPALRTFQRLYPMLFAAVTVRATSQEALLALEKYRKTAMAFIATNLEGRGSASDREAQAMTLAARIAMRDTRPEDLQGGLATRLDETAGVPGGASAAAALTPLSVTSFGGTVVHQG
jgi:hypothetical protein